VADAILARDAAPGAAFALLDRWALVSGRLPSPLGPEWLGEILPPVTPTTPREETVRRAKTVVADHFGVPRKALDRATKQPAVRFPRQVAMYLVWRAAALPLREVAEAFGLKSHAAASRALAEVRSRRDADPDVESLLDGLIARL
jgi:chromosomal replication initiation ATPase DnaA